MPESRIVEEAMVHIWMLLEEKEVDEKTCRQTIIKEAGKDLLDSFIEKKLLQITNGKVSFTVAGEKVGRRMIRRNRLAERLFYDVLEIKAQSIHLEACKFEHLLSKDVEEHICTLLGHPTECPHGAPIPPGKCCHRVEKSISRLVSPLSELKSGEKGKIAYIKTGKHPQLHKLMSLGLIPGINIKVHQTYPTYVIQVEETQLALDEDVASEIYVRCQ